MTRNVISTSIPPQVYNEIKQRHLKFSELLVKGFYAHLRDIDQPAEGDKDWEIAKRERSIVRLNQALAELNIEVSQQKAEIAGLLDEIKRLKGESDG
jgi:hypothetical protein